MRAPTSGSRWRSPASSTRPRWSTARWTSRPACACGSPCRALTMAEYFRDVQNQDVLLFVDNIFRFVQAGSEVSTLLGRMPSAVGYQPTLADEMGELQERITSTRGRSITSLQAVYVPADDYTDPAPFTTFTHLDATTELSPPHRLAGHLPGGGPAGLHLHHPRPRDRRASATTTWPAGCRRSCSATRSCRTSSPSSVSTSSPRRTASSWTGPARCSASCPSRSSWPRCSPACRASSCRSRTPSSRFDQLVDGELDDLPEQAFLNVGDADSRPGQGPGAREGRLMALHVELVSPRARAARGRGRPWCRPAPWAGATSPSCPVTRRSSGALDDLDARDRSGRRHHRAGRGARWLRRGQQRPGHDPVEPGRDGVGHRFDRARRAQEIAEAALAKGDDVEAEAELRRAHARLVATGHSV